MLRIRQEFKYTEDRDAAFDGIVAACQDLGTAVGYVEKHECCHDEYKSCDITTVVHADFGGMET